MLSDNPQEALNRAFQRENAEGWNVVQVIPDDSGNLMTWLLRLVILVCTLFLYTPANGYFLVMETRDAAV